MTVCLSFPFLCWSLPVTYGSWIQVLNIFVLVNPLDNTDKNPSPKKYLAGNLNSNWSDINLNWVYLFMRHKNHSIEFDWELLKCDQCIKLNRIKSNQNQIKPKWVDETNTYSLPICTNDCELGALILQCYSSDQFSRSKISIIPLISLFNFILKSNPSYSCRKWLESFSFFFVCG